MSAEPHPVDVAVIGGGPAGLAASLAAARANASVALFEAREGPLDKPCGEGLMPFGRSILEDLGVQVPASRFAAFDRVEYDRAGESLLAIPFPSGTASLRRPHLIAALREALGEQKAVHQIRASVRVTRGAEGYEIWRGECLVARSRTLIAADGLHGRCAPWLRGRSALPNHNARARFGLRARIEVLDESADAVRVSFGSGYALYTTPLSGGGLNLALLVDGALNGGAKSSMIELLLQHGRDEWASQVEQSREADVAARRLDLQRPLRLSDGTSYLAGDAAGGVDPVIGCGTSLGLETGARAGEFAARVCAGIYSAREIDALSLAFEKTCVRRARAPRMLASVVRQLERRPRTARAFAAAVRTIPGADRMLARVAAHA